MLRFLCFGSRGPLVQIQSPRLPINDLRMALTNCTAKCIVGIDEIDTQHDGIPTMPFLYKRGDIWYIGYTDANGRQQGKSTKCTREIDARRKMRAFEDEQQAPPTAKVSRPRFHDWDSVWAHYAGHAETNFKPSTVESRKWAWNHATRAFAPRTMSDITPERIDAYKASWKAAGRSPATFNDLVRAMSAITGWAIGAGLYGGENPWLKVRALPEPKPVKQIVKQSDYDTVINMAEPSARLAVVLGLYFGLRKGEIVECRCEWFDWNARTLTVYQDNGFTTKSGLNRSIPIFDAAMKWLDRKPFGFLVDPDNPLPGDHRYRTSIRERIERLSVLVDAKLGVKDFTAHVMRHSFCTNCLAAGATVYDVATWMGHSTTYITEAYRHAIPVNEQARRLFG